MRDLYKLLLAIAVLPGCGEPRFTEPVEIKGETLDPQDLNEGYEAYMLYCYACHGENGDGHGPAAASFRPPPRDFTKGVFKFGGVEAGELPHDEDLERTIRRGLDGTPMLAWDITDRERHLIVQYIKTLSPRWTKKSPGERIVATTDPWRGRDEEGIARGRGIYHLRAQCSGCHSSYVTRQELSQMAQELNGAAMTEFPPDMYRTTLRESQFSVDDYKVQILPPDFLFQRVKNGTELDELYRTIASGIGGTAMPMWKGALPEEDLWALVHYVKSLIDLRDTNEGRALRRQLMEQPPFVPPPPPAPAPAPGPEGEPAVPAPAAPAPAPAPEAAAPAPAAPAPEPAAAAAEGAPAAPPAAP